MEPLGVALSPPISFGNSTSYHGQARLYGKSVSSSCRVNSGVEDNNQDTIREVIIESRPAKNC